MKVSSNSSAGWEQAPTPTDGMRDGMLARAGGGQPFQRPVTLNGNAGTYQKNIVQIQGTVTFTLNANVLQQISAHVTGAYIDFYDGVSSTIILTENLTGSDLSALPVGSPLRIIGDNAVPLQALSNGAIQQPGALHPITLTAKSGTNSYLRLVYTTTDNPCSGQIQFVPAWVSAGQNGAMISPP